MEVRAFHALEQSIPAVGGGSVKATLSNESG